MEVGLGAGAVRGGAEEGGGAGGSEVEEVRHYRDPPRMPLWRLRRRRARARLDQ